MTEKWPEMNENQRSLTLSVCWTLLQHPTASAKSTQDQSFLRVLSRCMCMGREVVSIALYALQAFKLQPTQINRTRRESPGKRSFINLLTMGIGRLFTDKAPTSTNWAVLRRVDQATSCSPFYVQTGSCQKFPPCGLHLHILTKISPLLSQSCGSSLCLLKIASSFCGNCLQEKQ